MSQLPEDLAQKPRRTRLEPGVKLRGKEKLDRIPARIIPVADQPLRKPDWIRVRMPAAGEITRIRKMMRELELHTVCEEASCPNLPECFGHGTATFMIMGDICTRRCPFCDVAHGKPKPLDTGEPLHLAQAIRRLQLKYVVITSVDRDDLKDSGAAHFAACIREARALNPTLKVEILAPDFRGRREQALVCLAESPPDVFNHNLESVPRLYREVRPGADYQYSLELLRDFAEQVPGVPTKSGLMLGLGETLDEVREVITDLYDHKVRMLTLGQYLQPSRDHLPVQRFVHPDEFRELKVFAEQMGFDSVASGPMVRSSYHADLQASGGVVE